MTQTPASTATPSHAELIEQARAELTARMAAQGTTPASKNTVTSPAGATLTQDELIEQARQTMAARRAAVTTPPATVTAKREPKSGPTAAEREQAKLDRAKEREEKKTAREQKRAESIRLRKEAQQVKRGEQLPQLSGSAKELADMIAEAGLQPALLAGLAAHIRYMADQAARACKPSQPLQVGDAVIIARAQHPRYAGKVGIITDLRKVRAFVSVPGERIEAYAFVTDLTPATVEVPRVKKPTSEQIAAATAAAIDTATAHLPAATGNILDLALENLAQPEQTESKLALGFLPCSRNVFIERSLSHGLSQT